MKPPDEPQVPETQPSFSGPSVTTRWLSDSPGCVSALLRLKRVLPTVLTSDHKGHAGFFFPWMCIGFLLGPEFSIRNSLRDCTSYREGGTLWHFAQRQPTSTCLTSGFYTLWRTTVNYMDEIGTFFKAMSARLSLLHVPDAAKENEDLFRNLLGGAHPQWQNTEPPRPPPR